MTPIWPPTRPAPYPHKPILSANKTAHPEVPSMSLTLPWMPAFPLAGRRTDAMELLFKFIDNHRAWSDGFNGDELVYRSGRRRNLGTDLE